MKLHANAKLGLAGRRELVLGRSRAGVTLRQASARYSVSPATVHRWWHRSGLEGGGAVACLLRSSIVPRVRTGSRGSWVADRGRADPACPPRDQPRSWPAGGDRYGGRARRSGRCSGGTGLSRRPRGQRGQRYRRYAWSRPGALLHLDVKKLARLPGCPATRATAIAARSLAGTGGAAAGTICTASSTTTPLVYVEQHAREDAETNARDARARAGALRRARPRTRPRRS